MTRNPDQYIIYSLFIFIKVLSTGKRGILIIFPETKISWKICITMIKVRNLKNVIALSEEQRYGAKCILYISIYDNINVIVKCLNLFHGKIFARLHPPPPK